MTLPLTAVEMSRWEATVAFRNEMLTSTFGLINRARTLMLSALQREVFQQVWHWCDRRPKRRAGFIAVQLERPALSKHCWTQLNQFILVSGRPPRSEMVWSFFVFMVTHCGRFEAVFQRKTTFLIEQSNFRDSPEKSAILMNLGWNIQSHAHSHCDTYSEKVNKGFYTPACVNSPQL